MNHMFHNILNFGVLVRGACGRRQRP